MKIARRYRPGSKSSRRTCLQRLPMAADHIAHGNEGNRRAAVNPVSLLRRRMGFEVSPLSSRPKESLQGGEGRVRGTLTEEARASWSEPLTPTPLPEERGYRNLTCKS